MTTVLTGITWEHARGFDSVVAAAREYRSIVPDVAIRWEFRSLQAFADEPIARLAERYDLLVIDHPHVSLAAHDGLLAALDGRAFDAELAVLATQSLGRSHESYSFEGHQYGLATDAAAQVAVYRPDLLDEPPAGWAAVLELAREGRVLWPAKPIDAYSSLITVAANAGSPPFQRDGEFLAEADALAAFDVLHRLAAAVPGDNLGANPIAVADTLSTGDRFAYAPLAFGYSNYSRRGFRPHRLRYTDIPAGPRGVAGSLLGGAGIAVSAFSAHVEAAVAYAFWLASVEVQSGVYFDGGGQPGNRVAWEDDRVNAVADGFFVNTRATLDSAFVRPKHPGYIAVQDRLAPLVSRVLKRELCDADAIVQMNDSTAHLMGSV